jgi:hypothetical protein
LNNLALEVDLLQLDELSKVQNEKMKYFWKLRTLYLVGFGFSIFMAVLLFFASRLNWNYGELGPIGDYYGGIANSLALIFVGSTMLLQIKEARITRENQKPIFSVEKNNLTWVQESSGSPKVSFNIPIKNCGDHCADEVEFIVSFFATNYDLLHSYSESRFNPVPPDESILFVTNDFDASRFPNFSGFLAIKITYSDLSLQNSYAQTLVFKLNLRPFSDLTTFVKNNHNIKVNLANREEGRAIVEKISLIKKKTKFTIT